jgi:DNA polymerase III subunit beta
MTIITQNKLTEALSLAGRAVPSRTTMPILGNVLLRAHNGTLSIGATDLEKSVIATIPARDTDAEFELAVPARQFSDLVASLTDGDVRLRPGDNRLTVTCGKARATFPTMPGDEYPEMAEPDGGTTIPQLPALLSKVAFSASSDESHPVLTGVLMERAGGKLTLAAADGFRLAILTVPDDGDPDRWIIPAGTCDLVARLKADAAAFSADRLRSRVAFSVPGVVVGSQLIDGSFPQVERIIPESVKTRVAVDRAALLGAVKRAGIFARDVANIVVLDVQAGVNSVTVSAESSGSGQGETEVKADIEGPALVIAFNARFLVDALGAAETDDVVLGFNSPTTPLLLTETGDGTWKHVIMPMHLGRGGNK